METGNTKYEKHENSSECVFPRSSCISFAERVVSAQCNGNFCRLLVHSKFQIWVWVFKNCRKVTAWCSSSRWQKNDVYIYLWYRSSHQRCSVKKGVKKALRHAALLKKRLWHRCFAVNFAKFLGTPFLQNTSGGLLLMIKFSMPAMIKF